ncbi:MAG: PF20097 family protein [Pyrinomonadaceae bacterium]
MEPGLIVTECPKCGGVMAKGLVANWSDGTHFQAVWLDGEPEFKSFLGVSGTNLNTSGKAEFSIRALRCSKCGILELYAV